ncbi:PEP/pyruvate-binding domain-containing protein [Candidatus Omnitrophota bacterium]
MYRFQYLYRILTLMLCVALIITGNTTQGYALRPKAHKNVFKQSPYSSDKSSSAGESTDSPEISKSEPGYILGKVYNAPWGGDLQTGQILVTKLESDNIYIPPILAYSVPTFGVTFNRNGDSASSPIEGPVTEETLHATIASLEKATEDSDMFLDPIEAEVAKASLELLKQMAVSGNIYSLKSDDKGIFGFAQADKIFLDKELLKDQIALFHMGAKAYFIANPDKAKDLNMSVHTFLRGSGSKDQEKGEFSLGLQDKIFGVTANKKFTQKLVSMIKKEDKTTLPSGLTGGQEALVEPNLGIGAGSGHIVFNEPSLPDQDIEGNTTILSMIKESVSTPGHLFSSEIFYSMNKDKLGRTNNFLNLLLRFFSWPFSRFYMYSARLNLGFITRPLAWAFERYCLSNHIGIVKAVSKLYGKKRAEAFIRLLPQTENANMIGYAQSPITSRQDFDNYLKMLIAYNELCRLAGKSDPDLAASNLMGDITFALQLKSMTYNPSFRPRVQAAGYEWVPSREILGIVGGIEPDESPGSSVDGQFEALPKDPAPAPAPGHLEPTVPYSGYIELSGSMFSEASDVAEEDSKVGENAELPKDASGTTGPSEAAADFNKKWSNLAQYKPDSDDSETEEFKQEQMNELPSKGVDPPAVPIKPHPDDDGSSKEVQKGDENVHFSTFLKQWKLIKAMKGKLGDMPLGAGGEGWGGHLKGADSFGSSFGLGGLWGSSYEDPLSGMLLFTEERDSDPEAIQLIKERVDLHNQLIDNNFAALELIALHVDNIDRETLEAMLELVGEMVTLYDLLTQSLDKDKYMVDALREKLEIIKDRLLAYSEDELAAEKAQTAISGLEKDPEIIDEVETLHEFIRFLHEQSFHPLTELAQMANATTEISVYGKSHSIIDISSTPIIRSGRVSSPLFANLLNAFDHRQSRSISSALIINDDLLIGHFNLGLHKAQMQAKVAPPDEGGMISIRYQEWGTGSGNRARLAFLEAVMQGLGLHTDIIEGKYMDIRIDKDHNASTMEYISEKIPEVVKALYYTRDLDLYIKDEDTARQAAAYYLHQGYVHKTSDIEIHKSYSLDISVDQRRELNQVLTNLGILAIPDTVVLSQKTIDRYVNRPVDERVRCGQLVWAPEETPEGEEPSAGQTLRRSDFDPVQTIIEELSGQNGIAAMQIAELITPLRHAIDFRNIGTVGRLLVQVGSLEAVDGTIMVVTSLKDPDSGNIVFARVAPNNNPDSQHKPKQLINIIQKMGFGHVKLEKIPRQELLMAKEDLRQRWPEPPVKGVSLIKGIPSSPGHLGQAVRGKITFSKESAQETGMILMTNNTTPEDVPNLSSFSGIITTSGGVLAHAAITSRELGIPSIIIPGAQRVTHANLEERSIVSYLPGKLEQASEGIYFSRDVIEREDFIFEGSEVILDGKNGRLILESEKDALSAMPEEATREPKEVITEESMSVTPTNKRMRDDLVISMKELRKEDSPSAGPKGANLGELKSISRRLRFKVPDGFAVTINAFNRFIEDSGIAPKIREILEDTSDNDSKYLRIHTLFVNAARTTDGDLKRLIMHYAKASKKRKIYWSVRSSNVSEDSENAAFAGLGDTYLFVHTDELFENVARNFSSFATPRALAYRFERGIGNDIIEHAVFVQEMVDADISGVIFTEDPVTKSPDDIVLNASFGLGEPIVSGRVQPDQYTADKDTGALKDSIMGSKRIKMIPRQEGHGTKIVSTPLGERSNYVFGAQRRKWIRRLTKVARGIEAHYGHAVDIEFAIKWDTLYILQARPITTKASSSGNQLAHEPLMVTASPPSNRLDPIAVDLKSPVAPNTPPVLIDISGAKPVKPRSKAEKLIRSAA